AGQDLGGGERGVVASRPADPGQLDRGGLGLRTRQRDGGGGGLDLLAAGGLGGGDHGRHGGAAAHGFDDRRERLAPGRAGLAGRGERRRRLGPPQRGPGRGPARA